jgi:hypothetical protein
MSLYKKSITLELTRAAEQHSSTEAIDKHERDAIEASG